MLSADFHPPGRLTAFSQQLWPPVFILFPSCERRMPCAHSTLCTPNFDFVTLVSRPLARHGLLPASPTVASFCLGISVSGRLIQPGIPACFIHPLEVLTGSQPSWPILQGWIPVPGPWWLLPALVASHTWIPWGPVTPGQKWPGWSAQLA